MAVEVPDKKADLAGPGIGNYDELERILPRTTATRRALTRSTPASGRARRDPPRPCRTLGAAAHGDHVTGAHDVLPHQRLRRGYDSPPPIFRVLFGASPAQQRNLHGHALTRYNLSICADHGDLQRRSTEVDRQDVFVLFS